MKIIKPNKIIAKLILVNFSVYASWGFVMPIFALYITNQVSGGTIEIVGIAIGIYWTTKAFFQPFLAYKMDSVKGERDDIIFLLSGVAIITIVSLFFIIVTDVWHVFLLMSLRGMGMAMIVPTISGVFTRHINKDWESYMWSLSSTSISFAHAFSAVFGGLVAGFFGFKMLFGLVSIVCLLTGIVIYSMLKNDFRLEDEVVQEK